MSLESTKAQESRSQNKAKKSAEKDFPRLVNLSAFDPSGDSDALDTEARSQDTPETDLKGEKVGEIQYVTEPVYVTELQDPYGYALLREEDIKPRSRKFTKNASFVLEVVRVVESNLYSYSERRQMMQSLQTKLPNTPFLRIISPLLLTSIEAVASYHPELDPSHTMKLPYPYALLVQHRQELQDFKTENPEGLADDILAERNRHIDCALALIQAEHGQELEWETERLARQRPTTVFKNYWIHLRPGTTVYRNLNGVFAAGVISSVSGGISERRTVP